MGTCACRKVEHLSEEAESLRQALDKFVGREVRREREAQERNELLSARRGGGSEDLITEVERDRRDLDSVKRSNMMLEQTLSQGLATLANMAQNREMLKVRSSLPLGHATVLLCTYLSFTSLCYHMLFFTPWLLIAAIMCRFAQMVQSREMPASPNAHSGFLGKWTCFCFRLVSFRLAVPGRAKTGVGCAELRGVVG